MSQLEQILQLAASLPPGSETLNDLSGQMVKALWNGLKHPPLSYQGDEFKYRMADGSNNNIMYPNLGKAGSPYARTVDPQTLQPGTLPDPGVIFDSLYQRRDDPKEHPNKISSMLFYLASIIIHDVFHTDERDYSRVKTSAYLDLAPLYGSSQEQQDKIRTHKDGLLKADSFSESRVLGFPPGVAAMLVCFNRYHNYIAQQLKIINENERFTLSKAMPHKAALAKQDNDLFQTARLVNCGLYVNIILCDYVRTILNLNRTDSTWTLDPRESFSDVFDDTGTPSGVGNSVSVEFNLVYRWHSAISIRDEQWSNDLYKELFPDVTDPSKLTMPEFINGLREWERSLGKDPTKWTFGGMTRDKKTGAFLDADLIKIIADSTEDVACAFGPRQVPKILKLVEVLGIQQARLWNVATLNEFRKFFKLEPHKSFDDITKDVEVAKSLETLYRHPDYVELYPGIVAEDAKIPLEPGSGLCPGYTISRTILSDATTLARGDRFYTVDYSPANLTNWGYTQVKPDPQVAGGQVIYNLLQRALPGWYRGDSVFAFFPFVTPEENRKIQRKLGKENDFSYDYPVYQGLPTSIKTWEGVTSVLKDQARFKVPWGPHTSYLTHHDYMLSGDGPEEAVQKAEVLNAVYCPRNWEKEIQTFYEDLTTQLVTMQSSLLYSSAYQLDAVRDVGNPSHAVFVARMFHLPLITPDSLPTGATIDGLYLGLAVLFAYVFLDLDSARSFKLRASAVEATGQISKLVRAVCQAVKTGETLHLNSLYDFFSTKSGDLLSSYGVSLIRRLFASGKSTDDLVWEIIPTIAAAVATQAQHFAQMLDVFLHPQHAHHWPDIQALAWSNEAADFEKLKKYALEANRLAPAAFGLLRVAATDDSIADGAKGPVEVSLGDQIYMDFVAAGLDESVFPNPTEIDITRNKDLYIHHGYGPHKCLGRPIVEIAMAAQLRVFAKLKGLKRAPGLQGELKLNVPEPSPGKIEVFMKEDWSDWWPFPTSKFDEFEDPLEVGMCLLTV